MPVTTVTLGERERWVLRACWLANLADTASFGLSRDCLKTIRRMIQEGFC